MVEPSELRRVPAFADLPDDQIAWFISHSEELAVKAGDTYVRQGDPADAMYVILEGELQARGERGGETFVFPIKAGDVTGALPFSRMKQFTVTGRTVTDARLLRFPAALFPDLVQKMPELASRLVGVMSDRIRARCPSELTARFNSCRYPSDSRDCCELDSAVITCCGSDTAAPDARTESRTNGA